MAKFHSPRSIRLLTGFPDIAEAPFTCTGLVLRITAFCLIWWSYELKSIEPFKPSLGPLDFKQPSSPFYLHRFSSMYPCLCWMQWVIRSSYLTEPFEEINTIYNHHDRKSGWRGIEIWYPTYLAFFSLKQASPSALCM